MIFGREERVGLVGETDCGVERPLPEVATRVAPDAMLEMNLRRVNFTARYYMHIEVLRQVKL
jgi:hypothetical protein